MDRRGAIKSVCFMKPRVQLELEPDVVSHAHSQQLSKPESCPHHLFLMPTKRLMLLLRKSPREIRFSTKASRELEEVG